MSTIKSSAENLTLNADGANNDIKFQSNGSEVAAIDQAGNLTVSGTVDGVDVAAAGALASAALPKAGGTMTGQLNLNSNLDMGDNHYIAIGAGDDFQIYHDGTHSYIKNTHSSGSTRFNQKYFEVNNAAGTESMLSANENSGVILRYDNVTKLTTTNTGVAVTGLVTQSTAPAFAARYANDASGNWNGEWFIPDTPTVNTGSHYNASNGRFYAPVAGNYFFSVNIRMNSRSGAYWYVDILKNGTTHHRVLNDADDSYDFLALSGVIPMAANDYVQSKINTVGDTSSAVSGESSFSGFLIG